MKHRKHAVLLIMLVLVFGAPCGWAQVLKVATLAPDGTAWMKEMRHSAQVIGDRTGGRVHFKFYPGGVMGSDRNVLRKIQVGQLQGGAISAAALAVIDPDSQLYGLPLLFRSYDEVDYVRSRMDGLMMAGLEGHGFVGFGIVENGFAYLMSNRPIRRVEDLQGLKVWIPEGDLISETFFEAAGRSPIPLAVSDVLTGLQTGLIETVGTPAIGAIALQWHTAVKYVTDVALMYTYGMLVLDTRAVKQIALGDLTILQEVLGQSVADLNKKNRDDNGRAKQALKNQGITFIQPLPEELEKLRSIAQEANRRLAQKGIYNPEILEKLQGSLKTFREKR